jgi:predicted ATPase/DNA-binding SARP family transcriptional activator/diacylglycerol kinase family enzyme
MRDGWSSCDPPRRPVRFVNPRSGEGAAVRAGLADRARERGITVVVLGPGHSLTTHVDEAVGEGADALGMAGGDGSFAIVATAAAAHDLPFICVPAGTRNHFALDLGVDRHDVVGALDAFTDGVERQVDLAEVNGRAFLNNVSLGIYGDAVRQSGYRDAKVRTLVRSAEQMLGPSGRTPALRLVDDAGREHSRLAVVLVSNNPYALDRPVIGSRPSLDGGRLGILLLDAPDSGHVPPGRAWTAPDFDIVAPMPVHAHRRRGGDADGAAALRQPPGSASRAHLVPTLWRLAVSAALPGRIAQGPLPAHPPGGAWPDRTRFTAESGRARLGSLSHRDVVAMAPSLEIRMLGPFEAQVSGRTAALGGPKRQALLAFLAVRGGRTVPMSLLVDALWEAEAEIPASPRNAVQHHVSRLRATLGAESIPAGPGGYALVGATVDASRFEKLLVAARSAGRAGDAGQAAELSRAALALWRGRPLEGLPASPWVRAEVTRLEELRIDAMEQQSEAALALGDHTEVVGQIRPVLHDHPFRERLWELLILALYRGGRQAEALEAYGEARQVLVEQLGVEPGPSLQRLHTAILAHDSALAGARPVEGPLGRLPAPVTSFVGREQELGDVAEMVGRHRLVTLIGPPGVGKSRLALEVARALERDFPSGVWFVELARAGELPDVAQVVARTMDARTPTPSRDPLARVVERLRRAHTLLVLDGCEPLVEEAARVVYGVLAECSGVRVLVTSREVLHLEGEARYVVAPLAVPEVGADAVGLEASESVRLFFERAWASRPGLTLTKDRIALTAEICRRLDGLPLGIELAAARVSILGLREILSALDSRRPLFLDARDRRDIPQRYLRTVVTWSYDLLDTDEKALLHQLAVFRGGASRSAVVATTARAHLDGVRVTQLLSSLVDKSILTTSFPEGGGRYDLLDSVRAYVLEQLAGTGGLGAARRAHAEHFADVADAARTELREPEWLACSRQLKLEHDNLWAALAYAREAPAPRIAVRLGGGLGWYFALAERVSEGRGFLEAALAAASGDALPDRRIELLAWLCYLAAEERDLDTAIAAGERAMAAAATTPTRSEAALVRGTLSLALALLGDNDRAAAVVEEARAGYAAAGSHWGVAGSSLVRGQIAVLTGDVSVVATMTDDVLRHSEAIGYDVFVVPALMLKAWVAENRDDPGAAADAYWRAFELARRIGFVDHASFALARLGANAFAAGDTAQAEELSRRALATADAAATPWLAAHARVLLARVLEATGDLDTAESLYRGVVEWSQTTRPRHVRESLFLILTGSPEARALERLARLVAARGPDASTARPAGAATMAAGDGASSDSIRGAIAP